MHTAQPDPVILDLRNRRPSSSHSPPPSPSESPSGAGSPSSTAPSSLPAAEDDAPPVDTWLRDQIVQGLVGKEQHIVPGKEKVDETFRYKRTVPTMVLYSERGLEIYEDITNTKAYYPFEAEKEILEQYGDEIACRMFGLPSSILVDEQDKGEKEGEKTKFEPSKAANTAAKKEKWGDPSVGLHNYGVNGGLNHRAPLHSSAGLAVELGSGSLEKTRHLLRSMAKLLQPKEGREEGVMKRIDYKALDLEAASLRSTLSLLASIEGDCVTTSLEPQDDASSLQGGGSKRRVSVSGLHATYDEGLAFLKEQAAAAMNGETVSPFSSPSSSPERLPPVSEDSDDVSPTSTAQSSPALAPTHFGQGKRHEKRATSILWLGSSIGNFTREEAVEFLKGIELSEGDTMLIGVDGCADGPRIETAYNDPEGVTRAFILEGVDVAGRTLGEEAAKVLKADNFEYVNRWNAKVGRHEAYIRAKVELCIPLPEGDVKEVTLSAGELLQIEVSYKYTFSEALALFHLSGLRLVQRWTDSSDAHSLYLVEKPKMWFPSGKASAKRMLGIEEKVGKEEEEENQYGLPRLEEWEEMWKAWDGLMLDIIPPALRFQKPIPLRHVPLFYVGHIPAFRDIHLSRMLNEPFTSPAHFTEIFERGIDPDVDEGECKHWHSEVPQTEADWPKFEEICEYEQRVRARVRAVYDKFEGKWTRRMARVMMMTLEHEQMHWETAIYICLQACKSLNLPPGTTIPDFPSLARSTARALSSLPPSERNPILSFPAQTITVGHDDLDKDDRSTPFDPKHEFGWDCEHPKREEKVGAFKIDAKPIANGEYFDWLVGSGSVPEGEERDKLTPCSWAVSEGGVQIGPVGVKTLFGEVDMQYAREWPVAASAEQLARFAKEKGGRLPTFGEQSVFNAAHPVDTPLSNIGFANLHPVAPTLPAKSRDGNTLPATDGGLWQWTSSTFKRWEGYSGSEVYPGYSEDFFDDAHNVVLGGSYASPRRLARPSFQNWYQRKYTYFLGAARVAYDA
ncbi:hypothetical protein JCM11251_003203 [Rhodosporidiobolus azoricus]